MRRPRLTLIELMAIIILAAIVFGACRALGPGGLVATGPFVLAVFIARVSSRPRALPWTLAAAVVGTLLLPFLAAIWINQSLWGYLVARPSVDRRIVEARRVETITSVDAEPDDAGVLRFVGHPIGSVDAHIQEHPQEGDYYLLSGRVLRDLKARGKLDGEFPTIAPDRLDGLYQALLDTGRLEAGDPGYDDAQQLRGGIAVEAVAQDGTPLIFVGSPGWQVSNDHYPYYEFLFARDAVGRPAQLLDFRRFYYDVAGIEGLEWPAFFVAFTLLGFIPTLILQLLLAWRLR